jgi:hypothetical protein
MQETTYTEVNTKPTWINIDTMNKAAAAKWSLSIVSSSASHGSLEVQRIEHALLKDLVALVPEEAPASKDHPCKRNEGGDATPEHRECLERHANCPSVILLLDELKAMKQRRDD